MIDENCDKPQWLYEAKASCQSKGDNINATAVSIQAAFGYIGGYGIS